MKLISDSGEYKKYALEKNGRIIEFNLVKDSYYNEGKSPQWKTTQIEIKTKESEDEPNVFEASRNKSAIKENECSNDFTCNFTFDRKGNVTRCILKNSKGMQRTREYYNALGNITKEEMQSLNKGMTQVRGIWVKDSISFPPNYEMYYYDEETGEFKSEKGDALPKTVFSEFNLPDMMEAIGSLVSGKFMELINENETPKEMDIDDKIML